MIEKLSATASNPAFRDSILPGANACGLVLPSPIVARPPDALAGLGKLTNRAVSKSANMTFFDATKSSLDEKISLKVNARLVNPACRAGVLTSRPNFNARWGLTKCNGNEVTQGDL